MILVDFSAVINQMIFGGITGANPHKKDGQYVTSEFIKLTEYYMLESLFNIQTTYSRQSGDVVICLDNTKNGNWRRSYLSHYKASRKIAREKSDINYLEVFAEIDKLIEVLKKYSPWKVVSAEYAEADDVILILARKFAPHNPIFIFSADKDMIQAQRHGPKVVQYSPITKKFLTPETKHNDTMNEWLVEHVVLGDPADEVPKITDDTVFSKNFIKYLNEKKIQIDELQFDILSNEEKENIVKDYNVFKKNTKGVETSTKDIFDDLRFGPASLKKKIKEFGSLDNWLSSNQLYFRHYERNKKLILDEFIPKDIQLDIINNYNSASNQYNEKEFRNFIINERLSNILTMLPQNFKKATEISVDDFI